MMFRWTYLLIALLLITMSQKGLAKEYYSKLEEIEANNLNGNAALEKSLEEISGSYEEFNQKEKDYYHLLVGHSHYMHGRFEKVKEELTKLIKRTKDLNTKARATSVMASSEWIVGNTVDSFVYLDKAISLLPAVELPRYRVSILQNATGIYKEAELLEYALDNARRLKVEAEKDGTNLSICAANYELSSIELMTDKLNIAKSRLLLAKEHCEKAGVVIFQLGVEDSLATIELKEGKFDKGIERLKGIMPLAKKVGWKMGIAILETNLAEQLFNTEKYKEAEKLALNAFTVSEKHKDKKRMEAAAGILAQIYTKLDDKEKALEYYDKYRTLNSSNQIRVRQRKLAFDIARRGKL